MGRQIQIAVLQPELRWQQAMPNMLHLRKLVDSLPAAVQCVVLPEVWAGVGADDADLDDTAGQCQQFLRTLARARQAHVVGGTLLRRHAEGRLENVAVVVDPGGAVIGEYTKRVLFGGEQDTHRPGVGPLIFEVAGLRVAALICADLWRYELAAELHERADLICVATKTGLPSDLHVEYARTLWHGLALTRAMESGLAIAVSDWAVGRHAGHDVDVSVGSVHAPGMTYDPGILHRRPREREGPLAPTARSYTSAAPALGGAVHYTAGAATICDPGQRPYIERVQRTLPRGEAGVLIETVDLEALQRYRDYRRSVGLLSRGD